MPTKAEYLISLSKNHPEKVRDTWKSLGGLTCTNATKVYFKDAIYQIDNSSSPYDKSLIYVNHEYRAESNDSCIEWENMGTSSDIDGIVTFQGGIVAPHFSYIMSKDELDSVSDIAVDESIIPFSDFNSGTALCDIPDNELMIILSENGVPFISLDELEYSKTQIINIFIKPMLDIYWTYFPYIEEEFLGNYGPGATFEAKFPQYAYKAIPYYAVSPSGGAAAQTFGAGALNYARTEMSYGMFGGGYGLGGSRFGGGVRYNKPVPGYTGGADAISAALMNMAAAQGYQNLFRREKYKTVIRKEDGKNQKYAIGFTTIGGSLNIKWLESRPEWDYIEYDDLHWVRDLCKGNILQNFGMLRSMVNPDAPSKIDYSLYSSRGEKLVSDVMKYFYENSRNLSLGLMRNGAN